MRLFAAAALLGALALAGCDERVAEAPPAAHALTADAVGHYCGMNLAEHEGPKAQILLAGQPNPVWFSSARDAFSFTMLPEEAKDIRAIYVSDMAKAPNWSDPGAGNWTDARKAFFVIDSDMRGGMGAPETVPFSTREAADAFAGEHGGRVVGFDEVPRDYVLGTGEAAGQPVPAHAPAPGGAHGGAHKH